jgi:hypothetical protein
LIGGGRELADIDCCLVLLLLAGRGVEKGEHEGRREAGRE